MGYNEMLVVHGNLCIQVLRSRCTLYGISSGLDQVANQDPCAGVIPYGLHLLYCIKLESEWKRSRSYSNCMNSTVNVVTLLVKLTSHEAMILSKKKEDPPIYSYCTKYVVWGANLKPPQATHDTPLPIGDLETRLHKETRGTSLFIQLYSHCFNANSGLPILYPSTAYPFFIIIASPFSTPPPFTQPKLYANELLPRKMVY